MYSQVTNDLRHKAHSYCSSSLGGSWSQVEATNLIIKPLPHALTNELFICALPEDCNATIKKVVLRLYGKAATSDIPLQIEIVKLLASKSLGPQLYGSFQDGRLEEYLPSSTLTCAQIRDPKISCITAKKIALLQQVKVPNIESSRDWIVSNCRKFHKYFDGLTVVEFEKLIANIPMQTQQVARKLAKVNMKDEIEFLDNIIQKSDSPLVFSNNDLHQNNILLVESSESKSELFDRIVLIDFDYACENFQPFELANHFAEWRFDYHQEDYPYMKSREDMFPTKEQIRRIVSAYLNEWKTLNNLTTGESTTVNDEEVDAFIEEMEPFVMASDLLWSLWGIKMAIETPSRPTYWHLAGGKMDFYLSFKERYILKHKWLQREQSKL